MTFIPKINEYADKGPLPQPYIAFKRPLVFPFMIIEKWLKRCPKSIISFAIEPYEHMNLFHALEELRWRGPLTAHNSKDGAEEGYWSLSTQCLPKVSKRLLKMCCPFL